MLRGGRPDELAEVLAAGDPSEVVGRLSALFLVADQPFFHVDLVTDTVTWSRAVELHLGYPPHAVGRSVGSWWTRVHPDDRERVAAHVIEAMASNADVRVEGMRVTRPDGTHVPVLVRASVLRENGRAIGLMGAITVEESADERAELLHQIDDLMERSVATEFEQQRRELVTLVVGEAGSAGTDAPSLPTVHLTPRQADVLDLVRAGSMNKEIAARLGISEQAAKEHVSHLLRRFGAPNRAALVTAADTSHVVRDPSARGA